tara:strand:+ start:1863 stop:2318 length:456 start_codon:yes stop_codon:yes gene_type:complete
MKKIIDWIRKYIVWIGFTLVVIGIFFDSKSTTSQVNIDKEENVNIDKEENKQSLTKGWNHWEGIGKISMGFENSLFRPEGMGERWWAYFESDSIASIYFDAAGEPKINKNPRIKFYKPLKFKIKGIISSKGSHGHMGMYQRQILIQGISEN